MIASTRPKVVNLSQAVDPGSEVMKSSLQFVQYEEPWATLADPAGHSRQAVLPMSAANVPGGHARQVLRWLLALL